MDIEVIDESEILLYLDSIPPTPKRNSEATWSPRWEGEQPPF